MSKYKNNLLSTSALAKSLELAPKTLFELLQEKGWIERIDDQWKLTGKGQFEGGDYVNSKKYGEYIGWPETILEHKIFAELFNRPMRTRVLAEELGISGHRFNALLVERGWQMRFHRGWVLTDEGRSQGGIESEDDEVGVPYTLWPRQVLENAWLQRALDILQKPLLAVKNHTEAAGEQSDRTNQGAQSELNLEASTHSEWPTLDGHRIEFAEHALVDNWLYLMDVAHSYRYTMQDESLGRADFYIPLKQLFIEVWHAEQQGSLLSQKLARLEFYKANNRRFIEVTQQDILNLDRYLPKALLKQGITVF